MENRTLVIGIGNPDREDDSVAWYILNQLAERLGCPVAEGDITDIQDRPSPHLICDLQLTPEMAETISQYQRVCFVDAHTGA